MNENGRTRLSQLKPFSRQRDCGKQLRRDLDDHLAQSSRMGDLRIDSEMTKKTFDQLEQVDKRLIARIDNPGRLIHVDVTRIRT